MDIYKTFENIINTKLINSNLKFCLVNAEKVPFTNKGTLAKPNNINDFVSIDELLLCENLESFSGIGISIQASNVFAIDVDKCFSKKFDINSADERAKSIIELFKNDAYIEFSFSGTGLRILFNADIIENYSDKYYIKNSNNSIEFYQPNKSFRYVTVTGKCLYNNDIKKTNNINEILFNFLNTFMIKPKIKKKIVINNCNNLTLDDAMKLVKKHYFVNINFQNLWFDDAPGSGSNESERDFHLISYIYSNIVQDEDMIKDIFELSPFYKSKDYKHKKKWSYQDYRYYHYVYNKVRMNHI